MHDGTEPLSDALYTLSFAVAGLREAFDPILKMSDGILMSEAAKKTINGFVIAEFVQVFRCMSGLLRRAAAQSSQWVIGPLGLVVVCNVNRQPCNQLLPVLLLTLRIVCLLAAA